MGGGKKAEKAVHPKRIVEHKKARERTLKRYKKDIGRLHRICSYLIFLHSSQSKNF
jgi:hypothetical protein